METNYIGLFKRFLAFIMDAAFVIVLGTIATAILGFGMGLKNDIVAVFIPQLVALLYFTLMESSSRQATLGKAKMKIKVVNENGERLSFLNALGRYLGKFLSLFLFGLGFFMIPFSKKKQALHDKLAKTYVVEIENYEEYVQEQNKKVSSKIFAVIGFILFAFLVLLLLASLFTSDTAKGIGNVLGLVIGGVIWIGIFYGLFKLFKATGGDEQYLASKMFANLLGDFRKQEYRVKQKGDITSSSHKTQESAINMTRSAQNECEIFYKNTSLGIWKNGQRIRDK